MNKAILIGLVAVLLALPMSFALQNSDILVYWSMDDSSDSVGSNDVYNESNANYVNGGLNGFLQCVENSAVAYGDVPSINGDFSYSFWMADNNTATPSQFLIILDNNSGTATKNENIQIYESSSGTYTFRVDVGGSNVGTTTATTSATFDHYVVLVNDVNDSILIYKNGVYETEIIPTSSLDYSSQYIFVSFCHNPPPFFGSPINAGAGLDEVFFYDGLLTAADISALYNGGTPYNPLTSNATGSGATVTVNYPVTNHVTGNATPTFGFTPEDNSSTISSCDLYTNTTGSWASLVTDNTITAGSLNTIQASTLSSQTLLWGVRCTYDGNVVFSENRTLIIDTVAPTITLTSPPNKWYKTTAPGNLDFYADDNEASALNCTLRVDGNTRDTTTPNVLTNTSYTISSPDTNEGNHTWAVNCTDNAGNEGSASRWYVVDNTAPSVAAVSPLSGTTLDGGVILFTIELNETLSPNVTCDWYINNTLNKSVGYLVGSDLTTTMTLSEGSYYWWADCRDRANNNGSSTFQYINISAYTEERLTIRNGVQFRTFECSGVSTPSTCNAIYTMQANYTNLSSIEVTNNYITFEDAFMELDLRQNPITETEYNLTNVIFNTIDNLTSATVSNWSMIALYDRITATYTEAPYGARGLFVSGFDYSYTATQPSYVDATGLFTPENLSDIITISFLEAGKLRVNVYNVETGELLYQNTTVTFEDSDVQTSYVVNGTAILSGLTLNTGYDVRFEALNFDVAFYSFTYDVNHVQLDAYLNPNGTAITFNVIDTLKNPIQGATVTVYRFVNGTNTLIGQINTEITGDAVFILNTSDSHTVTVAKSGYTSQTFKLNTITQAEYTIQLKQSSGVNVDSAYLNVAYNYTPTNDSLKPNTTRFAFEITAPGNDLNYFGVQFYNKSTLIATHNISYLPGGGTAQVVEDLEPYNSSWVTAVFFYQRDGFDTVYISHSYYITDQENYIGSLLQLRDFMKDNVDSIMRIVLWAFGILIFALVLGSVVRGVANAAITMVFGLGLAWVFSLNLIVIGLITFVLFLGFISANRGEFT